MIKLARTCALVLFLGQGLTRSAWAQASLYTIGGSTSGAQLGEVAAAGDLDHDGVVDFLIASPEDDAGAPHAGSVRVISGSTGAVIYSIVGTHAYGEFGAAVADAGDTNNDGWDDFLVGEPGFSTSALDVGRATLYSGRTGSPMMWMTGSQAGARLGREVAGLGDLDHDGFADFGIAAPFEDVWNPLSSNLMTDAGTVTILSGRTHALLYALDSSFWLHIDASYDLFGWSLASAGDVDADGWPDIVVGATQYDTATLDNCGACFVFSGHNGGLLFVTEGSQAHALLGWSVAGVGDINGDGHDDIAVGAPFYDGAWTDSGRVLIVSGVSGTSLLALNGVGSAGFGVSVAGLGDIDGDAIPDFVVGAPRNDTLFVTDNGMAQVFSGATGQAKYAFFGTSAGDELGACVAGVGDINHDGYADLIAGAPYADPNGSDSGSARVVLLHALQPTSYCTAKTNSSGCVPDIGFSGAASISVGDNFVIDATSVLPQKSGLLFWGLSSAASAFQGGTLCVHAPLQRTAVQIASGNINSPCSGTYAVHFSHAYMASQSLAPGTLVYAQFWSRDPGFAPPNNAGLTGALSFHVLP